MATGTTVLTSLSQAKKYNTRAQPPIVHFKLAIQASTLLQTLFSYKVSRAHMSIAGNSRPRSRGFDRKWRWMKKFPHSVAGFSDFCEVHLTLIPCRSKTLHLYDGEEIAVRLCAYEKQRHSPAAEANKRPGTPLISCKPSLPCGICPPDAISRPVVLDYGGRSWVGRLPPSLEPRTGSRDGD